MLSLYFSLLMMFSAPVQQPNLTAVIEETFVETNKYRVNKGKDSLVLDPVLSDLAQKHSENMANGKVRFGHDGFNKRTEQAKKKIGGGAFAENVFMNPGECDGKTAVQAWINSEGHRKNMVSKSYKKIGIGVAVSDDGSYYFTQIFSD